MSGESRLMSRNPYYCIHGASLDRRCEACATAPDPVDDAATPWRDSQPGRVPPRECIANARDALNRAYSHPGITDGSHALIFIAEAVDWQRRALEQMVSADAGKPEANDGD